MTSAESNSNIDDSIAAIKQEHLTRFNTKYNQLISGKKQASKIKPDSVYDDIVSVVKDWEKGERFSTDQTKRNYGNTYSYNFLPFQMCFRFVMGAVGNRSELFHGGKIVVKESRLFEILYVAHTTGGHCGRDITKKKFDDYFGITK